MCFSYAMAKQFKGLVDKSDATECSCCFRLSLADGIQRWFNTSNQPVEESKEADKHTH